MELSAALVDRPERQGEKRGPCLVGSLDTQHILQGSYAYSWLEHHLCFWLDARRTESYRRYAQCFVKPLHHWYQRSSVSWLALCTHQMYFIQCSLRCTVGRMEKNCTRRVRIIGPKQSIVCSVCIVNKRTYVTQDVGPDPLRMDTTQVLSAGSSYPLW